MPRKGRSLEIMMQKVNEFILPDGFSVKSPEEFYEDGRKIGEIDVTIRGQFGLGAIFIGIECRDRPNGRKQGREWIRELIGKRRDLRIDQLVGVSSTGFTSEAIKLANEEGIELIDVRQMSVFSEPGWLSFIEVVWDEASHEVIGAIKVDTEPRSVYGGEQIDIRTRVLTHTINLEKYSLDEILEGVIHRHFRDLARSEGITQADYILRIKEPFFIETGSQTFVTTAISVPVRVKYERIRTKMILTSSTRLSDNALVAQTGLCSIKTATDQFRIMAIQKTDRLDATKRHLRFMRLSESGVQEHFPAGTELEIFRVKGTEIPSI